MMVQIVVPTLGESVTEATVSKWFKKPGDAVAVDEPLVELETDKVTLEVSASSAGVLAEIVAPEGTEVAVGAMLGEISEGAAAEKPAPKAAAAASAPAPAKAAPAAEPASAPKAASGETPPLSPAVRKLVTEKELDAAQIAGTGPKGRITKEDVLNQTDGAPGPKPGGEAPRPAPAPTPAQAAPAPAQTILPAASLPPRPEDPRGEERVRMSRLRQRIAERLKHAQNTAAMLTTYNEIEMDALLRLRSEYREAFEKKHGVRLGFLSFFVKAAIVALKEFPAVNAEIYGDEIVYKNYYDIGVAVGTPQGLVVPVLRDADRLSFAGIEAQVAEFGKRARDGKLTIADMTGGTFTISNGGVYGSLLSMPIINPPQSAILGMHKVQKRPVVDADDSIRVASMMYLALSYDHRIIDGREAVTFLVRMKEVLEDPQRLLLDV
ncbi:MAG: 2-oxoglutarate dehydrogenase complex dihydrolipoyllysine-residue succinyltransferase [Alphaproteobacteria bacterium]